MIGKPVLELPTITTFELALVASFSVASIPFHSKSCGLMHWATTFWKTSAAMLRSRWNSSEVSRARMSPSLEGTLALSLTDCVWTESLSTALRGLMTWIPSLSVSPVTRPKRVRTPTWPVGIETTLEKKKIKAEMAAAKMRIFEPTPLKLGSEGILPPALKLMVLFGITASVESPVLELDCSYFYYVWRGEFLSGTEGMGKRH